MPDRPLPDPLPTDLSDPLFYLNRELSWLEFSHRVLEQSMDPAAPLLERMKFLGIVASILDEFFMVRVSGLKRQVTAGQQQCGADGMSPSEQLRVIGERCHLLVRTQYRCFHERVIPGLARHGIQWKRIKDLTDRQREWAKGYFHRQVFPVLSPLAIDPGRPFPHLRNCSLNLVVTLRKSPQDRTALFLAVVQVPSGIPRLVQVPGDGYQFVLLEDLVREHVAELFQGPLVTGCYPFRITRDSDLNFEEDEAEDLLATIEAEVRKREWGDEVRLEVSGDIGPRALRELIGSLEVTEQDVYNVNGPLNLADFMALYRLPEYTHLRDEPFTPPIPRRLQGRKDIFAAIREGDVLLHHPYESFNTVVDFVEQAAVDPDVLAIKQTLYRTSGDSALVAALSQAAVNGKQVTVLVELMARFDEANNLRWARELERAGVHVVYGLVGLKTHCKLLLVVRREPGEERLRRYVHLGTGNYHPSTARLYTDLGLLTCNLQFGQDVSRLFNVLTGYSQYPTWRKLSVAPLGLRERVVELIDREAQHARQGKPARIIAQMNSLTDPEPIRALYRASQAGVKIDLIIRGICCLRAGLPGISENIRVTSIVGRFLEHCRIFYFRNSGEEEVYLSSADWMNRNFSRRVETMFPVEDPDLKRRIVDEILAFRLRDTARSRELKPDGKYARARSQRGQSRFDSQAAFLARSLEANAAEPKRPLSADLLLHGASRGHDPQPGVVSSGSTVPQKAHSNGKMSTEATLEVALPTVAADAAGID